MSTHTILKYRLYEAALRVNFRCKCIGVTSIFDLKVSYMHRAGKSHTHRRTQAMTKIGVGCFINNSAFSASVRPHYNCEHECARLITFDLTFRCLDVRSYFNWMLYLYNVLFPLLGVWGLILKKYLKSFEGGNNYCGYPSLNRWRDLQPYYLWILLKSVWRRCLKTTTQ